MKQAIIKILTNLFTYIVFCGLLFIITFSIYTKKFPPDFIQLRSDIKNVVMFSDSLKKIHQQQNNLLKSDLNLPDQTINQDYEKITSLYQKVQFLENQNEFLMRKLLLFEQQQKLSIQRIENIEKARLKDSK
jgi:hypothetical protein